MRLTATPSLFRPLVSVFCHANNAHLYGNAFLLLLFGRRVEGRFGQKAPFIRSASIRERNQTRSTSPAWLAGTTRVNVDLPPPRFSRKWRAQHSNHPFSLKEDLGWRGMVVAYLFCGVCANMASLLLLPGNTISLGASGAVFGRFGPSTTAPSPRLLESLRARFRLPSSTPPHRNKLPKLDTTTSNPPPSSHKASSPSRCSPG
jgi:hypothetical protein